MRVGRLIVRDCTVRGILNIPAYDETDGSGGLVGVMDKEAVFEGKNKVACEMHYGNRAMKIGGAVGGSSFTDAQTKQMLGSHVEVADETVPDASSVRMIGRYCGSPWIDEL